MHVYKHGIETKNRTEREVLTLEIVKLQQFLCRGSKGPSTSRAKIHVFNEDT